MRNYITFLMAFVCLVASAQNINDVLRYSTENVQGTARFQGLGGAFGALGGDLSAIAINPAGSAIFKNNLITVTGTNYNTDNEANYFNSFTAVDNNNLEFNQGGAAFVFKNTDPDADWKKIVLAINYDLVQNFDETIAIRGNSTQGIDNYFLNIAQGQELGPLFLDDGEFIEEAYLDIGANLGFGAQQTFLGYFGGIIDPVALTDDNTSYISNAQYTSLDQSFVKNTSGFNSKFTFNLASQFRESLYLGAALNFHTVVYDEITQLRETGFDADSEISFVDFDNLLHTEGVGFSLAVGAIAKLNENIRIGGSYQSPTWYRLTDDTSQRINSDLADSDINFIDFNIINLFDSYRIKTPGKLTGSLALIFGKYGLLSFDYDYQDFSEAELRPTGDPSFAAENVLINDTLGTSSSYRVGGEIRLQQVSLRAGYRFQESPSLDGQTIGDLEAYSGGIGYSFGGSRLDLAYSRSEQDFQQLLFDTGLPTPAAINRIRNNVSLSYTFSF